MPGFMSAKFYNAEICKCSPPTDVCGDPSKDDLTLILSSYSCLEVRVIPCIDFSVSPDKWSIGIHGRDLFWQESIGASFSAGSKDNWDVEELRGCSMGDDVVLEYSRVVIADLGALDLYHRDANRKVGVAGHTV